MSTIKQILTIHVICLFASAALATDAERIELSKQVIKLSQGELVAQQMLDLLVPAITGLSLQQNPNLSDE
ncbi:MAG: hypothetical protein ACR2P3_08940 [Geminicoccaceae bacterium]